MKTPTLSKSGLIPLLLVCAALPVQAALRFDGVNDHVTFGVAPALGTTNFTIECWFKREGSGAATSTGTGGVNGIPLVTKGRAESEAGATNMNYFTGISTNNLVMADFEDRNNGLNHPITGLGAAGSNSWQHVAVTFQQSGTNGTWITYLNGLADRTNTFTGANTLVTTPEGASLQHAALGSALLTTGAAAGFFNGSMEEVRIWNIARSAAQISTGRNQRITNAAGLIGRWALTETNGTVASDTSGSGVNGTLLNGPVWTTESAFTPAPPTSGTNLVFNFNNAWRYMQTTNLDGTLWKQSSYNDAAWPSGAGVLGLEDCACLPQPINTALTLFTNRLTHYFRTHFTFTGNPAEVSLLFSNLVDNGAVFYLNGSEVQRVRMPTGTITDTTPASEGVGDATAYDMFMLSGSTLSNLVVGDNVIAAEIHQADFSSSDVVFGMSLSVVTSGATNSTGLGGLAFDGADDIVTMGQASSLGVTNFTLECWFKPSAPGKRANTGTSGIFAVPLITKGMAENEAGATNMNYFFGIGTNNAGQTVLAADFEDFNNGLNHPVRGSGIVNNGAWQHGAVTYNSAGSNWVLYLNGVPDTTNIVTGPSGITNLLMLIPRADSLEHAAIGSSLRTGGATNADSGFFAGTMDEVRIWSVARSAAQIASDYNRQITTNSPGLIARWSLDDGAGTTATNSFGGIHGTLLNGPVWAAGYPFPVPSNAPPVLPVLVTPTNNAFVASSNANLVVTVSDPESAALTVTYYGRVANGAPAPGPDFTLLALPDTQHYTAGINGGIPDMFTNQTQWIVNNRSARNIQYLAQLGDCVQNGDNGGNDVQWRVATNSLYRLENPATTLLPEGLPYGIAVGNHDQGATGNGDPNGPTVFYNQYFGEAHFGGYNYYGDNYGTNNDNHYDLFSASGLDFIVVYFEYDAAMTTNSPVLAWANSVLATNQNRRAIVVSHHIINAGFNATFSTQGQVLYDALKGQTNLFLMLSGHVSPEEGQRTNVYQGRMVWSVMTDYQGRAGGGNGWLRLYEFSPSNNVIRATTYSPWLNQTETDTSSQFNIAYNMTTANPFTVLGTVGGVASGANASMTWSNLTPGVQYEWYVTVSDGSVTTTSSVMTFTTSSNTPPTPLTVTINNSSRSYGFTNEPLSGTLTGVTNGDNITVSFTAAATTNSPIGVYPISVVFNDPGNRLPNYIITTNAGSLTVTQATLAITADAKSRGYGAANPVLTGSVSGIRNDDAITASYSTTATTNSPIGNYAITPAVFGASLSNYVVTLNAALLTVNPVILTATADNASRHYGNTNPVFTGTLTGVIAGDDITASYSTIATIASPADTYAITPSLNDPNNKLPNYTVTLTNGTLTIIPLVPPTISSIFQTPEGNMHLIVNGTASQSYHLQATEDLGAPAWNNILTNTANGLGVVEFSDLNATNHMSQFYRISTP